MNVKSLDPCCVDVWFPDTCTWMHQHPAVLVTCAALFGIVWAAAELAFRLNARRSKNGGGK